MGDRHRLLRGDRRDTFQNEKSKLENGVYTMLLPLKRGDERHSLY